MSGRFQRLPIATKLRVIITAACVCVVFLTCIALAVCEWFDVRTQMLNTLVARSQIFSANASVAVLFNSPSDAEEILGALKLDRVSLGGAIFRPDGTLFAQYLPPKAAALPPPSGPGVIRVFSPQHATAWVPMQGPDGHQIGTIALRMSLSVIYARFRLYALTSLGVMLAAAFFSYWLSHRLQQLISQPLLRLAAAADRVTEDKDFSVRVKPAMEDEIGKLTAAFNSMLATIQAGEAESARLYDQVRAYATGLEARVKERTAQLQGAYEEMESFGYSISHDLRGPLRHIGSYTELLLEGSQGKLTPETEAYAQRIIRSVQNMERLIKSLLDFSRLTKKEPVLVPVDLAKISEEIISDIRTEPGNAGALVNVEPMSPCLADPLLLRQILANLLSNAFKYSRNRHPPRITVSEIPTESTEHRTYAVKDNGVGFDARAASDLFKVFVRLHDGKQFEGTGVGLATVKRIVQRHGGRIWAESAVDAGATFFFTLPFVQTAGVRAERSEPSHRADG